MYASVFLEQPNQVGRYYKDLTPLIGKEIFSPNHEVHSYYTAAYIAYRLEFMFRNRRMHPGWKPFRFQIAMAARLILERQLKLDPNRKRSQAYCGPIDTVMADPDGSQAVFDLSTDAIKQAIKELSDQDARVDRRTAKMRDMRDKLRSLIIGTPLPPDIAADTLDGKPRPGGKSTQAPTGAVSRPKKSSGK
jgi:hypothetical protein